MDFRFPMPMTIRCYGCGRVFDVLLADKQAHEYPCPGCGRVEVFDLGAVERKALAHNQPLFRRPGLGPLR